MVILAIRIKYEDFDELLIKPSNILNQNAREDWALTTKDFIWLI